MNRHALELLRRLELAEQPLLTWGCVDGVFAEEEILALAEDVVASIPAGMPPSPLDVLSELEDRHWLWRLPSGEGYRTRVAEAVRLFAKLRQIFRSTDPAAWKAAPHLVADYRFLIKDRVFPRRDQPLATVLDLLRRESLSSSTVERTLGAVLGAEGAAFPRQLARFQVQATHRILAAAMRGEGGGTIVSAGTGSGKTLAFYLPALAAVASRHGTDAWTKALALYPRNELLKDQLREGILSVQRMARAGVTVVLGAMFERVPRDAADAARKWPKVTAAGRVGHECPYLRCPACARSPLLVWLDEDRSAGREVLRCSDIGCSGVVGPEFRVTREALLRQPPDILFSSTEMLNQRLADARYQRLLGVGQSEPRRPMLVLLDEAHTYEGTHGAHVAYLVRRWRALSGARAHFVGLSATLEDAPRFFADLVGLPARSVTDVTPAPEDLEREGAEYQLVLRGDPSSGTSLLSTSIQASMLLRRVLGPPGDVVAGSRVFAFTDNLDVVNRLFHNLLDAEGCSPWTGAARSLPLAHLRSSVRPQRDNRLREGQSWDLVESIGHTLGPANRLVIRRTSSQDQGVDPAADIVVATSALEVGFDDPRVAGILQHKAPREPASFVQRKGRAGRLRSLRPWTVVVTSDFGRDRLAYQAYEQLFAPTLAPRYLPLSNRSIQRMQATYCLLDWLGQRVRSGSGGSPWMDLASPPRNDGPAERARAERQGRYRAALEALLSDAPTRADFTRFVSRCLAIDEDAVLPLLWEPPRSVLLEAIPTMVRRLETAWVRVSGGREPLAEYGPPLPDFLQRTLFGDLLVPEVTIELNPRTTAEAPSMLIGQSLREFAPGRVSRRFGLTGTVSHWIDPGSGDTVDIGPFCTSEDRELLGMFGFDDPAGWRRVPVFRPNRLRVGPPPADVAPSSNAFPVWRTQLVPLGEPHALEVPRGSIWESLLEPLRFHMHELGSPIEARRFTTESRTNVRRRGLPDRERTVRLVTKGDVGETVVGLGFAADVDAVEVRFQYPRDLASVVLANGTLLRALRPARFRDLLRSDPSLGGRLNRFQRDGLAEAFVAAVALESLSASQSTNAAIEAVLTGTARTPLDQVLARMALWATAGDNDDGTGDGSEDDDETSTGGSTAGPQPVAGRVPRRLQAMVAAVHDPGVIECLRVAAPALHEAPSDAWQAWLRGQFKATLGAVTLQGILSLCVHVASEDLLCDLEVGTRPADGSDSFWITEATVGGGGAVEAFYREYAADPRRFFRLVEAAAGPSDLESVGSRLERLLLAAEAGDGAVRGALSKARQASTHTESLASIAQLRSALAQRGIVPDPSLFVSIHARVLWPTSSPTTDSYVANLIRQWDEAEGRIGYELDVRVFALATASATDLEHVLGVPVPGATEEERITWRYSTLRGLLWARGSQARAQALRIANPYSEPSDSERLLLAYLLEGNRAVVDLQDAGWFDEASALLAERGVVDLRAAPAAADELAKAILRVAHDPIDTGALRVHARLTGVRRNTAEWRATLELPEAFQ